MAEAMDDHVPSLLCKIYGSFTSDSSGTASYEYCFHRKLPRKSYKIYLALDMIDLIKRGAKDIVCLQPWACLPNHVTGKGMIKTLKAAFPETNIVAIDYDPSASSVNQTNRLKLMLTTTFENIREPVDPKEKPTLPFSTGSV